MTEISKMSPEFPPNWSDFVTNWCSGVTPSVSSDVGWRSLGAVERLWPEHLDAILQRDVRGTAITAPLLDLGVTFMACEHLAGFNRLLERMKKGERSALSEAEFAAALIRLGYSPVLEPRIGERRADALISVEGRKVYLEVITPDECAAMREAYSEMGNLAQRIMEEHRGMDVNVSLLVDPDTSVSDAILAYLRGPNPSSADTHKVSDIALIKCGPCAPKALSIEHELKDGKLPELFVAAFSRTTGGIRTRINVQASISDERAQRLMSAETRHFSREETNFLVMDVSMIPGGIECWLPLIQRRFQPRMNRRFSAVVLFSRSIESAGISWRSSVLANPYAYRRPPKCLIDDLARLGREKRSGNSGDALLISVVN